MSIIFSTLNHPLRAPLAAEIHSRPPIRLEAPERIDVPGANKSIVVFRPDTPVDWSF